MEALFWMIFVGCLMVVAVMMGMFDDLIARHREVKRAREKMWKNEKGPPGE